MKKLAFVCLFLLPVFAFAQANPVQQRVAQKAVQQASQKKKVSIPGAKRLVTVLLELQEHDDSDYTLHRYWYCPAVIFNNQGALAFDGECWKAFTEAANLRIGPAAHFLVMLGNFGEYTYGEDAGQSFYFESTYVADGPGDEYTLAVEDAFKRSADNSYIIFKRSLFNDPTSANNPDNSEVKKAIAQYYKDNNLKEVTAETLSAYFKQKHPTTKEEFHRNFAAR